MTYIVRGNHLQGTGCPGEFTVVVAYKNEGRIIDAKKSINL